MLKLTVKAMSTNKQTNKQTKQQLHVQTPSVIVSWQEDFPEHLDHARIYTQTPHVMDIDHLQTLSTEASLHPECAGQNLTFACFW